MFSVVQRFLDWIKSLFWKEEMELTLVGLQYSGKSTFVHVIATGSFTEDMTPTVGFVMRKITKGAVTIKMWDIGGQPRFRSMWERYCRGVNAIVFMVDSADFEKLDAAQSELHLLLERPQLVGIPLLVLGNKRDLPNALDESGLISKLGLATITDREVCCYSISCKNQQNLDVTLKWLIAHAGSKAKQARPTGLSTSRSSAVPPVGASTVASSSSPNLQAVSSAVPGADATEPVAKVQQAQAAMSSYEAPATTSTNSGVKQSKVAAPNFLSDQPPSPSDSVQNESDWSMHAAVEPIADQQPNVAENVS